MQEIPWAVIQMFQKRIDLPTEVAVAPKRRKTHMDSCNDSYVKPSENVQYTLKALLRVQDPKSKMVHRCEVNGIDLNVVLTSVVLIHPETAKHSSFDTLQLVNIVPRLATKENTNTRKNEISSKNSSNTKEVKLEAFIKEAARHAVVRLVYSESVAQGHIVIPQCLRVYLRAAVHSWVIVKRCNTTPKKDIPSLTLSPCRFKVSGMDNILQENSSSFLESHIQHETKNTSINNLVADAGITDWSIHEEVCATCSSYHARHEVEDTAADSYSEKGLQSLLYAWCIGQLEATAKMEVDLSSLILGNETLVQFEVIKSGNRKEDHFAQDGRARDRLLDILFLLSTNVESSHSDQNEMYEVSVRDEKRSNHNMTHTEMPFGKLNLADPIHLGLLVRGS